MNAKLKLARTAGLLYLFIIIFGLIAQIFVRDSLVNYTDAALTAKAILASESWYRFGFVAEILMLVSDTGVAVILYILLRDSRRNLSLFSTAFRIASIIILCVTSLTHYAALPLLKGSAYLQTFSVSQLETMALFSIQMHGVGYNISLLFFGVHLIILGYLLHSTRILPKFIGVLLVIGGTGYIINSIVWFQLPSLVKYVYPYVFIPAALGEWILCGWLLVKGIRPALLKNNSL